MGNKTTIGRTLRGLVLLAAAAVLAGCASRPDWLGNRLVCAVGTGEAMVVSRWGVAGISADIDPRDTPAECRRLAEQAQRSGR